MRSTSISSLGMLVFLCVTRAPAQRSVAGANSLDSTIVRQEQAVWSAIKAQDSAAFRKLMGPECLIVSNGRRSTADQYAGLLRTFTITRAGLSEIRVQRLSPDVALIHYRLSVAWTQNNKESSADQYVVSVYKRSDSHWLVAFNQDSPARAETKPASRPREHQQF